jgi:hypothetical protein
MSLRTQALWFISWAKNLLFYNSITIIHAKLCYFQMIWRCDFDFFDKRTKIFDERMKNGDKRTKNFDEARKNV